MKKFLKVLGAAALIAGFVPYQISGDEETGDVKVKALLWQLTSRSGKGEDKWNVDINFGFSSKKEEAEEADLFSDELTVNYGGTTEKAAEEVEKPAEETAEEVDKDAEEAAGDKEKTAEETAGETDAEKTEEA